MRDLSKKLGKKIELVTIGKEVEVDKSILEALADPLVHLLVIHVTMVSTPSKNAWLQVS